jgi:trehalose/maltose hydrolase-like predicted phosphorylase
VLSRAPGFEELQEHHSQAWSHLWHRFGLDIEEKDGTEQVRMILRLHIFHLLQTVSLLEPLTPSKEETITTGMRIDYARVSSSGHELEIFHMSAAKSLP